ncbi:MAG: bifunctional D-glycero-beta-D-manno-heptose-7-phosphate kinase/D-glycero-beta-D-manno-heptose 1-phosphate adenylyltransferase HldE [Succinivibrionaceae bacterium]|nr:bifunctional D-glycero-beta-D-manno-heptose-7-phosphate kinase/D-glycero-beta-D-manno-heptose 1-phosphate adenylyltransferase HldE [Succinivibrionaceae bacterium]
MAATMLPGFKGRVAIVGDVMLDRYWSGPCKRISPEAPVPVVRITEREERAGGAANVAINIASLGAPVTLVGMIGNDEAGTRLDGLLRARCIDTSLEISPLHPTITKLRVLSRNQQLIRIDFEDGADQLSGAGIAGRVAESCSDASVLICSDYGKGTLAEVRDIIAQARASGKVVLVDPKGTDFTRYRGATMLTPNLSEFEAVAGKAHSEQDLEQRAHRLIAELNLDALLVTRSEDGMSLFRPRERTLSLPTRAREVYDVTGAGDTVIATIGACLASGMALPEACDIGNRAAGIVVGKLGTSTVSREELLSDLRGMPAPAPGSQGGIVDEEQLLEAVTRLKQQGRKVVMTNGCFDLMHQGHVSYLERARALGDCLVVAVNSDESVQRLKGPSRPILPLMARMQLLGALSCVDYVVSFSEDTPQRLIARVLPQVLAKGGDYRVEDIAGHEEVLAAGGEVKILPFVQGCSTSAIVSKIRSLP